MELSFEDKAFQKMCRCDKALTSIFGLQVAKMVRQRLDELAAAPTLSDMRNLPGGCRAIRSSDSCKFAVSLIPPKNLMFMVSGNLASGVIDWSNIVSIKIVGVYEV